MSKSGKITLTIVAIGIAAIIGLHLGDSDFGTSVINVGNKSYYQDSDGNFWENKKEYEEYDDNTYYVAPDGSYWVNEYRYLQSQSER